MTKKQSSEFGKGFVYNLVLFSKHWWKHFDEMKTNEMMKQKYPDWHEKHELDLWFNGAGDHFFEFEIPKQFQKTKIGKLALSLQKEALDRRLYRKTTKDDLDKFFEKLELLCRMIDKQLGINDIEATWS